MTRINSAIDPKITKEQAIEILKRGNTITGKHCQFVFIDEGININKSLEKEYLKA